MEISLLSLSENKYPPKSLALRVFIVSTPPLLRQQSQQPADNQQGNKPCKLGNPLLLIDFTPLWETMRRKQVTQYQLLKNGLDNKTLDTLKKNRNITLSTLEKLCQMLDCTPNDVVQFIPDDKK